MITKNISLTNTIKRTKQVMKWQANIHGMFNKRLSITSILNHFGESRLKENVSKIRTIRPEGYHCAPCHDPRRQRIPVHFKLLTSKLALRILRTAAGFARDTMHTQPCVSGLPFLINRSSPIHPEYNSWLLIHSTLHLFAGSARQACTPRNDFEISLPALEDYI